LLADSLLVRRTAQQQKADKLSLCDLMIEVRIYFVEVTKGNMYRLVKTVHKAILKTCWELFIG
jgi:hypothetical protein